MLESNVVLLIELGNENWGKGKGLPVEVSVEAGRIRRLKRRRRTVDFSNNIMRNAAE